MQKKLLSGLFWVLLLNLIVKPFWILGIEVGVQNAVGNEMYGFYFAIFNLSYIFNILLDLGITNFNTRNIAQHPQLITKHLSGILGLKVCLLGLYLLVTFTVGAMLGYGSDEFRLLAWLTVAQFLNWQTNVRTVVKILQPRPATSYKRFLIIWKKHLST
jgi:O-antigen/teichoic acid export membrane protein